MNRSPSATQESSPRALFTLILALITLAAFWPTLSGEFVYDDLLLVKDNTLIKSFGNLGEAFSRPYWEGLDHDGSGTVGLWRPLTTVALMLGQVLGSGSALGFHAISVLAHLAVVICAAGLARRLSSSSLIGLWTGILFALHPVHVESVAWISGISDPVAGLFCLLTLSSHLTWLESGRSKSPWITGIWFFLALLSKESALAVLPMMLVIDLFQFKKGGEVGQRLRGYYPAIGAFFMYMLIRMVVFGDFTGGLMTITTQFDVPGSRLALLRVELLGGYMQLLSWPSELNLFRVFQPEFAKGDMTLAIASAWSALCVVIAAVLLVKKSRAGAIAWILIPASLLPMIVRISALGTFPLSDRYLYLAAFGFAFSIALLVIKKLPAPIATAILGCIAGLYAWKTVERTADWQSESTLFAVSAEQSPKSPFVAWSHGRVLLAKYKETKKLELLEQAQAEYERGMELLAAAADADQTIFATKRDHLEMNLGLAWCYLFRGELDAFRDFKTPTRIFKSAVDAYPESSNARVGLGISLMMLAETSEGEAKSEQYQAAGEVLREALAISASDEAHCALGQLLLRLGESSLAADEFKQALALRPGHLAYMLYLRQALEFGDDDAYVRRLLEEATALHPEAAVPIRMLGSLAVKEHRLSDALRWFEIALEKDANDGYTHLQRGIVLAQLGENREALKAVLRSCELAPAEFDAQYNAALLLLESNTPEKARDFLMRAYILRPKGTGNGPGSIGAMLSNEIRKIDPDDPEILWRLAESDRRLGQKESAIEWINRSIALNPKSGQALFTRGMLLSGDEETKLIAIADFERAAELVPENFDVHNELGHLLAEVGRHQDAIDHTLAAMKILPQTGLSRDDQRQIHAVLSKALATSQQALEGN